MPNNPGRINGDYSIGEKEEVKFVDPGSFGAVRKTQARNYKAYAIACAVAAIVIILALAVLG